MYDKEFATILKLAESRVDDIEILLSASKSFNIRINKQEIEAFNYADSKGIGVRVIKNGKTGYAYTEEFKDETFLKIIEEAAENSSIIEEDEEVSFENHGSIKNKLDIYSEALEQVDVTDKIEFTKKLEDIALKSDKRIINVPYAVFGNGKNYTKIANSKGLNKEDIQNYAFAYVGVLAAENDDKRMGFEFHISRDFNDFDPEDLVRKAIAKSVDLLGGSEIESGKYPVIFTNEMMSTVLATFSSIFSGKAVQEGKSLLKNKLGEKIACDIVELVDDALHPDGISSRAFDSEGYPSQTTRLIEKGKLKTFLHNTASARKAGTLSTGNAARNYKATMEIEPSNFYLVPGKNKVEDLRNNYGRVVEVVSLQGMHSGANPISGDFSLSAEGFLYEEGKRKHSLKQFTISGNILSLLQDIVAIADDFKFDMSSYGSASVLVKELNIASK